jgi:hypothetical protein
MAEERILIFRSWKSDFNRSDILDALSVYTDEELEGIRRHGYNGIWLRGRFRETVPSKIFPEFGKESGRRLDTLNQLVQRAASHGIGVYIYVNEPAGFPVDDEFWDKYPELKGSVSLLPHHNHEQEGDEDYYSFCTSTKEAKQFLKESTVRILRAVKDIAGIITISASEYQTHCYAHIDCLEHYKGKAFSYMYSIEQMTCPRCHERHPIEIVAEVNNLIHDGIVESGSKAKMIAWNWAWDLYEPAPQKEIITKLHKDIIIMVDFERGGKKIINGKESVIDEYSLTYIGPSERTKNIFKTASELGHQTMAKLQIGTTHELATVPNIPGINNVRQKIEYLINNDSKGVMACWNFGNMLTLNTYLTGWGMRLNKTSNTEHASSQLVSEYIPELDANDIVLLEKAWAKFTDALDEYPFNMSLLYAGPLNFALAYWLPPQKIIGDKKLGRSWLMDERGDDFSDSIKEINLEDTIECLERMAAKWDQGLAFYHKVFSGKTRQEAMEEYSTAVITGCCFKSACNVYKLYGLCSTWNDSLQQEYHKLCTDELANCKKALPFLTWDKRCGFHSECQGYQFDENKVQVKIEWLEKLLLKTDKHLRVSEKPAL